MSASEAAKVIQLYCQETLDNLLISLCQQARDAEKQGNTERGKKIRKKAMLVIQRRDEYMKKKGKKR